MIHRLISILPYSKVLQAGSLQAFILPGFTILPLIVRSVLEDQTLQAELMEYQVYIEIAVEALKQGQKCDP